MRPIRLELEGFTTYREFTVLDFNDSDLFVLTGPTGSGKSSLIDAMTFALYGSVTRYGNPNLVHPVISQGKLEAKVRFDFSLRGQPYTAARVVRRTERGGATTKEARLETGGQVLAGSADEVSRKVRELLGLNFEQFTTCVVLPQGEFARFLHEKPAQRQDLLTKLLGVEVYERMGNLARTREAVEKQRVDLYRGELERLGSVKASDANKLADRVRAIEKLQRAIEASEPRLAELEKRAEAARAEATRHEKEAELLGNLRVPKTAEGLAGELETARSELEAAIAAVSEASDAHARVETARALLPSAVGLHDVGRDRDELVRTRGALAELSENADEERAALAEAIERHAAAVEAVRKTKERLDAIVRAHTAHTVARTLVAGEPCPVCGVPVGSIPKRKEPKRLTAAEAESVKAAKTLERRERDLRAAEKRATLGAERRDALRSTAEGLERKLETAPSEVEIASAKKLDDEIASLRRKQSEARAREERARRELETLATKETRSFEELERARDLVTSLGPPATDRRSLGEAWTKLHQWAAEHGPRAREDARKARDEAERLANDKSEGLRALHSQCLELGLDTTPEKIRDAVLNALASTRHEKDKLQEALERAKELRSNVAEAKERAQVAGIVGRHLKASGFERWLLTEAFRRLAEEATLILKELSSGQYSFEYDDKLNFEVTDHRNADERRSARTLSGGESFLASLALALTLAEQTAELAASGSAPLESLFLDEGFGTLDNDTLDVVATAIQELGARGRVVGLVTHQRSLADQIPVQFRVSKGPVTSTVERVSR